MDLSIVIVNYRTWSDLEKGLSSLSEGFRDDWEVVVVDNDSRDGKLDEFVQRHPSVTFIAHPQNAGFARGCNVGASHARGRTLLFLNPDVVATSEQLARFYEEKNQHGDVVILTCRQVDSKGRTQKAFDMFPDLLTNFGTARAFLRAISPSRYPDPRKSFDELVRCDWVTGAALMIDRSDLERVGGWSDEFWMYSEDVDLCKRVRDAGGEVAMTPAVELIHHHGTASRSSKTISIVTKVEAIKSKHVYAARHSAGIRQLLNHLIIGGKNLLRLGMLTLLSVLFVFQSSKLNQCRNIFFALLSYYSHVLSSGRWLSQRAVAMAEWERQAKSQAEPATR